MGSEMCIRDRASSVERWVFTFLAAKWLKAKLPDARLQQVALKPEALGRQGAKNSTAAGAPWGVQVAANFSRRRLPLPVTRAKGQFSSAKRRGLHRSHAMQAFGGTTRVPPGRTCRQRRCLHHAGLRFRFLVGHGGDGATRRQARYTRASPGRPVRVQRLVGLHDMASPERPSPTNSNTPRSSSGRARSDAAISLK